MPVCVCAVYRVFVPCAVVRCVLLRVRSLQRAFHAQTRDFHKKNEGESYAAKPIVMGGVGGGGGAVSQPAPTEGSVNAI